MRAPTTTVVSLATSLAIATFSRAAGAVDVSSCAEFEAVDRAVESEITITTADFACDAYTRLSIRSNMVIKSAVGAVTFSNLSLKVYGSLTVEPDVMFTGITNADKNGGALYLQLGAVGVFQGTADFRDISIETVNASNRPFRKGGAIHSKGNLTFEKDATFTRCYNFGHDDDLDLTGHGTTGGGGAISQHVKGTMRFMGKLTMIDNFADTNLDTSKGEGGAFFNKGDVVVDGEATFSDNLGRDGGAIYQERWATFEFNSFATFTDNKCYNSHGGAIANFGGDMAFRAGSSFELNRADSNGDGGQGGGIYNYDGGDVTLEGPTSFTENIALFAGAIYNVGTIPEEFEEEEGREYKLPTISFPDDTVFEDNVANDFCEDVAYEFGTCGL